MGARFRSWWQKIKRQLSVIGVIAASVLVIALIVGIIGGYVFNWKGAGISQKTLWDWLQLLIIPFALAIIAIFFNRAERKNEQRIASDNQREAALQDYIKVMSELLLERNLSKSDVDAEVRTIARVQTLTVLPRLDGKRKRSVLQFLYESGLIVRDEPIIDLKGADLSHMNWERANLREAGLRGTNLREAILWLADLSYADLSHATLDKADLNGAMLEGADLTNTYFIEADLSGSWLEGADLSIAHLGCANLLDIYLGDADLTGLQGVTLEDLKKQARSLKGATMPDGSIHP